ncbi:MAG TPA: hypothetical protein VFL85_04185 [Candidatus Saccharimonadales bacterium]|nr:hypothetical protein [Candidatus Saccharimonadales bacterium]
MFTKKMRKYSQLQPYIIIFGLDLVFFAFLSPTGSTWVIIPALVLVIATIWLLARLCMQGIGRLVPLKVSVQRRLTRLLVIAAGLVVALQSIGQLTAKDVLTIVPLVAILYFYLAYAGSISIER